MWNPPQGLHDFLRAYYHYKSGDWPGNRPFRLESRAPEHMAQMPEYYIMALDKGMPETVSPYMPSPEYIRNNMWLPDRDLEVYVEEFGRTGFQGGLNWYRAGGINAAERQMYAGLTIDQPSAYIAGASDWGSYQSPGVHSMSDFASQSSSSCSSSPRNSPCCFNKSDSRGFWASSYREGSASSSSIPASV